MHRFFTGYTNPVVPETTSLQENISDQRGITITAEKKKPPKKTRVTAEKTSSEKPVEVPVRQKKAEKERHGGSSRPEPTYIVGIGASAGGLESFYEFFRNMPPDTGMAFVLVSHLDPNQKDFLPD